MSHEADVFVDDAEWALLDAALAAAENRSRSCAAGEICPATSDTIGNDTAERCCGRHHTHVWHCAGLVSAADGTREVRLVTAGAAQCQKLANSDTIVGSWTNENAHGGFQHPQLMQPRLQQQGASAPTARLPLEQNVQRAPEQLQQHAPVPRAGAGAPAGLATLEALSVTAFCVREHRPGTNGLLVRHPADF